MGSYTLSSCYQIITAVRGLLRTQMELRQTKKYQCKKEVELELYFKEVGKLKEEKKEGHFYMANRLCQKYTGGNSSSNQK